MDMLPLNFQVRKELGSNNLQDLRACGGGNLVAGESVGEKEFRICSISMCVN